LTEPTYRTVWQATDTAAQVAAMKFWADNGLLAPNIDQAARVAQLCTMAYDGAEVVGVATARIRPLEMMNADFALFRCAVAPEHRRRGIATSLAVRSYGALETWALEHLDRNVQGMACVVLGAELQQKQTEPLWPRSGLNLAGYDANGAQLRVAWFEHVLV
jgi:GNAT superfamily N-acetyltransferase